MTRVADNAQGCACARRARHSSLWANQYSAVTCAFTAALTGKVPPRVSVHTLGADELRKLTGIRRAALYGAAIEVF